MQRTLGIIWTSLLFIIGVESYYMDESIQLFIIEVEGYYMDEFIVHYRGRG